MSFSLLPVPAVLLGIAVLAGALYLLQRLRVRHREIVVPTTMFWHAAVEETRARVFVRKFRHPLAYALLLLIAALLWLAFAEPVDRDGRDERVTVLLLDGSAGMASGDRFARARQTLLDQVGRAPTGAVEVVFCGGWPRTLLRRGENPILLEKRLEAVRPEACPASLERAVADLAQDRPTRLVVIGDAPLSEELIPDGWELFRPGQAGERPANAGVLALGVSEAASGAWDRVDVYVEASTDYTVNLDRLTDVPALGQELVVRVAGGDAIALDDEARLVLPRRTLLRVRPIPELDAVLRADPGIELAADGIEIEIIDGADVVFVGPADALATAPVGLVEFVDAERGGSPVAAERRSGPTRRVLLGRELLSERFNFTRTRAFPLFVAQAVRWLAACEAFAAFVAAGETIPGTEFAPPVAGAYDGSFASLLDPLVRSEAARDNGPEASGGSADLAGWLALLAFALLIGEWYLHRTGRVP